MFFNVTEIMVKKIDIVIFGFYNLRDIEWIIMKWLDKEYIFLILLLCERSIGCFKSSI